MDANRATEVASGLRPMSFENMDLRAAQGPTSEESSALEPSGSLFGSDMIVSPHMDSIIDWVSHNAQIFRFCSLINDQTNWDNELYGSDGQDFDQIYTNLSLPSDLGSK